MKDFLENVFGFTVWLFLVIVHMGGLLRWQQFATPFAVLHMHKTIEVNFQRAEFKTVVFYIWIVRIATIQRSPW